MAFRPCPRMLLSNQPAESSDEPADRTIRSSMLHFDRDNPREDAAVLGGRKKLRQKSPAKPAFLIPGAIRGLMERVVKEAGFEDEIKKQDAGDGGGRDRQ